MRIRLIQRDHPSPQVNDWGVSHRDPYLDACWGAVLPEWTSHTVRQAAALTAGRDRVMSWEQFCQALHPDHAALARRPDVVFGAMQQAEAIGVGYARQGPSATICVYRNVPLLPEPELRRLNDPELHAHINTVRDINDRLMTAGHPPVAMPDWVNLRQQRSSPALGGPPENSSRAQARLDELRHQEQGPNSQAVEL